MTPTDLVSELRTWSHAATARPASDLMDEAAGEIEQLRRERDESIATMNICIREYQQLTKIAIDGDTLLAYRLGIKHAKDGGPVPPHIGRCDDGQAGSVSGSKKQDP
jgi:hypothetical protein